MSSLTAAIRRALEEVYGNPHAVDLHAIVRHLQPHYPEHSFSSLALEIARVAVEEGCRYFTWDNPEGDPPMK